jgi:hypothetical protein
MGVYNYPFYYPGSHGESHDPSRECFHVGDEKITLGDTTPVGQSVRSPLQQTLPTGPPRERSAMSAPVGTHRAELEQFRELKAKVDKDRR